METPLNTFTRHLRNNFRVIAMWPLIMIGSLTAGVYAIDFLHVVLDFMKDLGVPPFLSLAALVAALFVALAFLAAVIDWWNSRKINVLLFMTGKPNIEGAE